MKPTKFLLGIWIVILALYVASLQVNIISGDGGFMDYLFTGFLIAASAAMIGSQIMEWRRRK